MLCAGDFERINEGHDLAPNNPEIYTSSRPRKSGDFYFTNFKTNHYRTGYTDSACVHVRSCSFVVKIRMRILALDHGTKRVGIAISDELKMIAQPLEYAPAEPFLDFLERLKEIIREKEVELILIGMPRNMDGSYGPAALKVQEFIAVLKDKVAIPIQTWDERLTSAQAQRFLIQGGVRRAQRKEKVDKTAAAILLQSYLDSLAH